MRNSSRPAYRVTSAILNTTTRCKIHPSIAEIAARVMDRDIPSVYYGRREKEKGPVMKDKRCTLLKAIDGIQ